MSKKAKVSKYGQWQYPGEHTIIPDANGRITMQGVPYPVFGIDDLGNQQMMMPGGEYQFPGNSVYEIPMMAYGGHLPKAQSMGEFLYVKSKDDPAYIAYNDSLDLYNQSMKPRLTSKKSFGQYGSYGLRGRNVTDVPLPEGYTVPGPIQPIGQRITRGYYPQYVTIRPPYTPGGKEYRKKTHDVYKEPTRKVVVQNNTGPGRQIPTQTNTSTQVEIAQQKPVEVAQTNSQKPKDGYRRTPIGTANNGTVIRVHDNNQRFIRWEDENGNIIPIENATGSPSTDFDPIYKPNKAYGGDISVPDLRRVTIKALPKAQTMGELKEQALQRDWNRQQAAAWDPNQLNGAQEVPTDTPVVVKPMTIAPPAKNPPKKSKEQIEKEKAVKQDKKAKNDPTLWLLEHPEYMLDPDGNPVLKSSMEANAPADYLTLQQKALKDEFIKERNEDPLQQSLGTLTDENQQTNAAAERYANTELAIPLLEKNPRDKYATRVEWIESFTPQERAIIQGSNKAYEFDPTLATTFKRALRTEGNKNSAWQQNLDLTEEEKNAPVTVMDRFGLLAPLAYPTNLLTGALTGDFGDAFSGRTPKPYYGDNGTMRDYYQPEAQAMGNMLWQGALDPLNAAGIGLVEDLGLAGATSKLVNNASEGARNIYRGAAGLYNDIAEGDNLFKYAWQSPASRFDNDAKSSRVFRNGPLRPPMPQSEALAKKIKNITPIPDKDYSIIKDYEWNSDRYTGRRNYTDLVSEEFKPRREHLDKILEKSFIEADEPFVMSRRIWAEPDPTYGVQMRHHIILDENGIYRPNRPLSFSIGRDGLGNRGYSGGADRIVVKYDKGKHNILKNDYRDVSVENYHKNHPDLKDKPFESLDAREMDILKRGVSNEVVRSEREMLTPSDTEFKFITKVKNKIGGYDYIMEPLHARTAETSAATAKQPKWVKPSITQLKQEFRVEHDLKGNNYFANEEQFQKAVNDAKVEEITPEMDQAIQNKSRHASREAMIESNKNYKSWPKYRNENTVDDIYKGIESGAEMDMPIILEFQDGTRRMFSGNTRMDVAFQSGKNPKALIVKVPEASAAGETLNAADETVDWKVHNKDNFIKAEHKDLADTIDQLREDRIKFWQTPKGRARLEAVIENTPELKAGKITVDDYINSMKNMTNENRIAANNLAKADEILAAQERLIDEFENIKFLEEQTGMKSPNGMTEEYLQDELAKLQKQLDDLKINYNNLQVNTDKYLNNAFMNYDRLGNKVESNVIDMRKVQKPDEGYKYATPKTKFTIGVGQNYTISDARRIVQHELGHLIQRGFKTNLDYELKKLELLDSETGNLFSSAKGSSPDTQAYNAVFNRSNNYFDRARHYFNTGGKGQEKLTFLEEVRADMLERGIIKDLGDDITEGMIRQHYANYMMEAHGGKYPLRLYDIMKNNPKNFSLLQSVMNKMPVAVVGAGVGYGMMGGDEESQVLPQKKRGGGIKNPDFLAARNKGIVNSLPKAQTGGGPKLNSNPNFEVSYDISKSPEENMELNKRARQMGWNSVEEYKNSNWGQNQEGVNKVLQSNRDRKRYTSWQGVTGPGETPISQDEKTVLENTLKNVENWEKGWYSKRAMLPQFTGVAMERLSKLNEQKTVPWGNTIYENEFPDWGGHYSAAYNTVNIKRNQLDNQSLLTHERSHWYDYNAPQIKDYYTTTSDGGKYKMPIYNKDYDPILESIIPYEFRNFDNAHYRGFDPLQIPINASKQYDTEIEKILDADVPLPSTDNFNSLQDILKPFSSQDAHNYQYMPTEVRSRLNEWRKYNNIDPLKNYTDEEIQSIIDKEINDPNKPSWWNNMDLYKVVRGRGDLLKKLNDAYVSNGNRQSSDGVFRGERGGQLPKAQLIGSINKKSDASQPYMYLDSKTNTWLRPPENRDQNKMIDWSVNTPAFAYSADSPYNKGISGGKKVSPEEAARNKEYYRQEALKTPEGREEERKRLMQEFVDHENANKSALQSSFGNLSLDNPATRDAASNYAGYKLGESSPMWATDKLLTGHDEPTTRDFYRPHESTLSFGIPAAAASAVSLGAGAAELQPIVQGFNNLMSKEVTLGNTPMSINSLTKAKGTYDLLTNTAPEAYNSFKTYSQTGNTDDLLKGLENTGKLAIEGFSNFGPAKSTVKQIGKYYGIGQSTNDAYNAQTTGQFAGSSYDAGKGIYNVIKGKKKGGSTNTDTLPKAQTGIPSDYERFLQYSETAPENRRPDADWQYGNPRQYDHYGMWDALGKPENFEQALEMNPHWQPDPYDESYHGFSTNPNTGVWLKSHIPGESHPGDTGWMEYKDFMLSNDRNWGGKNQNLVYDPDLQRMRYVDRKNQGGDVKRVTIKSLPKNWKTK